MTYNEFKEIIEKSFPEVTPEQMEQFRKMDELYRDWNSKINVISRKDNRHIMRRCTCSFSPPRVILSEVEPEVEGA